MKYTYDWLGRMQTMTFPNWINQSFQFLSGEGEKVTYSYDRGGNIDRITGHHQTPNPQQTSHPIDFVYLDRIGYDQRGLRRVLISGNGIQNKYGYDAARRLTLIAAQATGAQEVRENRPPTLFHSLQYEYDKNGNITRMKNEVSVQPWRSASVFVGPLDVSYTYDALNQLRTMTSKYRPKGAYGYQSADTYTYDEIGNIKTKAQSQDRLVWDNQSVNTNDLDPVATQLAGSRFDHNVAPLTYTLGYTYPAARPHGATPVSETPAGSTASNRTYTYDANGNNTGNTFKLDTRAQVWDEENRLKQVTRNGGSLAQFRYDEQGERTKKLTAVGDTWYVNQFFALLPGNRPTKHIFAGETRVATKTDAITMQTPVLHYYHSDHLGTTGYISDKDQNLVQHERYFAFGELWRPGGEQEETDLSRPDGDRREWLFTGKEWDVDTGLYYFGARYFDPHADVWQSTDPILASYMRGTPNGGAFQPRNLGVYSYSWNNPIVLRDPTGHCVAMGTSGPCDEQKLATMEATRPYGDGFMNLLISMTPLLGDVDDGWVLLTSNSAKERKEAVVSLGMGFGPVPNSGPLLRSVKQETKVGKAAASAGKAIIVSHPSERAARRAAEREAGMGKHGRREELPPEDLDVGSRSPQGDPGQHTSYRSPDTGGVVHHDPYGHRFEDGTIIPPHYGAERPGHPTTHHTYPTTHDPKNNR
jgi:RHS repeat-associated protein